MCGIFGFAARNTREASTVLAGLRLLEYRGYDSWGVAVAMDSEVRSEKAIGKIANASTSLPASELALGHTRWATHGGVTQANAHPHSDCHGRLALIHNGIVENHQELRSLLRRDHTFLSQTDTEVLVHLLEESLEDEIGLPTALLQVFRQVEGLSAVAVLDAMNCQIAVAKNGSPMALGWGTDASYLASDPIALLEYTRNVTFLEDGQSATLSPDGIEIFDVRTGESLQPDIRQVSWDSPRADLGGYAHFMAKEIDEQPEVLRRTAKNKIEDAQHLAGMIQDAHDVYLVGCGTAHHAAISGKYQLAEVAGKSTTSAVASELSLILPMLGPDSLIVALSQSGETIDVLEAVRAARQRGARIAALVNAEGSTLHRFADFSVLLDCGPERCVLATKSYTAKLAVLHMTAAALAGDDDAGAGQIAAAAEAVQNLLSEQRVSGSIRAVAHRMAQEQHMFVLGRHRNYPMALEVALKVKEVSYMHAEGFAAGELKHGVIALVTYGTPCLILAPDDDFRKEALSAAAEVRARGAITVGFSPRCEEEFDITITVSNSLSAPYEVAAASQLLAYELALIRGCDPDKPRNLAKSVTVK